MDIIILSETKIDDSFPTNQFLINGFSVPFRADRNKNGGILVYIGDNIPAKLLQINTEIENICFHINLRNRKWFICAAYNPQKNLSSSFFKVLTTCVESYLTQYDNLLIIGDFNVEEKEKNLQDFMQNLAINNIVEERTCFKTPDNPSCIDLILTNRKQYFQNTTVVETSI